MGRARIRQTKTARTTSSSLPSIPSLLSKAQDLIVQCDYPLARKFAERILTREDATPAEKKQVKEMLAVVLLEIGDVDAAKDMFLALVPPHPEAPLPPPPSAYLYLAQLTDDDPHAALAHYRSAIDLLQTQLKGKSISTGNTSDADEDDAEIRGNIVRAYLGMIEIWMDPEYDLCIDPAASSTCDALLSHALQIDPQNLETLQTLASVRLSQEKPDEALRALQTFPPPSPPGIQEEDSVDAAATTTDADPHSSSSHVRLLLDALPIQMCIARAKLLLECGAYHDALSLLEGVLAADDANTEGWYLTGWTWWLLAERTRQHQPRHPHAGNAGADAGDNGQDGPSMVGWQDMARDARECLETCQTLHASQGHPDIPLLEHVEELIGTLDALGILPSPAEEEDGDDDGEWEEVSDEDEDRDVEMA